MLFDASKKVIRVLIYSIYRMESQSADDEQNLRLIAERDAILKQLAELGDDLSGISRFLDKIRT